MTAKELELILAKGEGINIEFKSWINAKNFKEILELLVKELVAFANAKGGTVFLGIEDNGNVTGCTDYHCQNILEAIYDRTRPAMYADIEEIEYNKRVVLAVSVEADGNIYATSAGACYKRLGKNSKPYYPEQISDKYTVSQTLDFSSKIIIDSSEDDINLLEVYNLKEKLKIRDTKSTLPQLEDSAFLRDLGLIKELDGKIKLTIAGLLFVGKDSSIERLLPQAEVIYLHYSKDNSEEYDARLDLKQPIVTVLNRLTEKIQDNNKILNVQVGLFRLEIEDFSEKVFQEAVLNALSHRDYQSLASVYVKHYPDKVVIENPGGFLDGITEKNIITHPSAPRNKLIAETLQRLKYVQRTGQGVDIIFREMVSMGKPYPEYRAYSDAVTLTIKSAVEDITFVKYIVREQEMQQKLLSLSELMILRYLAENKKMKLSDAQELTQTPIEEARKSCSNLVKMGMLELAGKEYMLTARVYDAIKTDVEYTRDRVVQYIKAKDRIMDYLGRNDFIKNEIIRELCGYTRQQARVTVEKMCSEGLIRMVGKGRGARYILEKNGK